MLRNMPSNNNIGIISAASLFKSKLSLLLYICRINGLMIPKRTPMKDWWKIPYNNKYGKIAFGVSVDSNGNIVRHERSNTDLLPYPDNDGYGIDGIKHSLANFAAALVLDGFTGGHSIDELIDSLNQGRQPKLLFKLDIDNDALNMFNGGGTI